MKALISPIEPRHGGYRIAEVCGTEFEIAEPFFWVYCDASVKADSHYYDPLTHKLVANPSQASQPAVPQSVSRFQARAALYGAGYLQAVEALMAAPETPMLAKLAWQDAQEFRRTSQTVLQMGAALGLTVTDLDNLFIAAAQIQA